MRPPNTTYGAVLYGEYENENGRTHIRIIRHGNDARTYVCTYYTVLTSSVALTSIPSSKSFDTTSRWPLHAATNSAADPSCQSRVEWHNK